MKWRFGLAILVVLTALAVAPATAQTFDNSGGGSWKEYMSFPITVASTEHAQYKIVVNGTTWEIYNVTGALEASGVNSNFWSLVNSTGADIRVFDQNYNQMYFWIESWDYTNQKAVIWVNLTANSSELNIAYGNPSALPSAYMKGEKTFEFFDDFEPVFKEIYAPNPSSYILSGSILPENFEYDPDTGLYWLVLTDRSTSPWSIILAYSSDLENWTIDSSFRLQGSTNYDAPCLKKFGDYWYIYYEHDNEIYVRWSTTVNGTYSDEVKVLSKGATGEWDAGRVGEPYVFYNPNDGKYYLFYMGMPESLDKESIGYATADTPNGTFVKWSGNPLPRFYFTRGDDNADPFVFEKDGVFYIGITASMTSGITLPCEIGFYKTTDFQHFEPCAGQPALERGGNQWDGGAGIEVLRGAVTKVGNDYYLVYGTNGHSDNIEYVFITKLQFNVTIDSINREKWVCYLNKAKGKVYNGELHLDEPYNKHITSWNYSFGVNYILRAKAKLRGSDGSAYAMLGFRGEQMEEAGTFQFFANYLTPYKVEASQYNTAWSHVDNVANADEWHIFEIRKLSDGTGEYYVDEVLKARITDQKTTLSKPVTVSYSDVDWIFVVKLADPVDFGAPLVKSLQKKFGTKTVYVNVTYLDTSTTTRHNPPAYYNLEDKPQINVTSTLSVTGVNATYGANISIELINFVTLDKVVYNGTDITGSLIYQGTITNPTTGYIYNVYNFTTYENGTLEIYGHVSNEAYNATYKLDGETVDIFNVTAVIGEPLEISLPHKGNISIASIEHTGVTSVLINTKDVGVGAKTLTITIDDPENFTVGYIHRTVNIDWGKIQFNITDLQNKTLARTTYGFFNKNFSIISTDPTKLYAGDIEIDVYFHGVKLKSLEIYLNHTNNGLTLNVSVNATQFKDYRNVTRIIASPNYFEVVNLSTKYPFSVMKLVNVSGTVVIDFVSNAPTSVKVEGATSYTYEKPVLKITASGNVTITDLYKLSTPLKDRLGNPVNFYVLINGSRVDASKGVASKLLKPSWYEVEVPITVSGFELWKFNDSSNIALVEINASDKTLPTAEYRVPSKIETKEVRIQKTKFPWLPFPFLSESKPAQEETPIVRLEGTLRDFYNAPVANRMIKIEVASPNYTRIYNVTTDSSGNFKIDVDMARGVEYKVTYKFAGDDVYVSSSTTKTFTIEQLLPAPPEEITITELLIFVGIAVGLIAVVAGAIYLARRTKAKTLARMESEFRFFRRLK